MVEERGATIYYSYHMRCVCVRARARERERENSWWSIGRNGCSEGARGTIEVSQYSTGRKGVARG
jgi:hypothetical protein